MKNKIKMSYLKNIGKMIVVTLVLISMLVGCQLADKEYANSHLEGVSNKDVFCGLFITTENYFYQEEVDISIEDMEKALSGEPVDYNFNETEPDKIYAKEYEKKDEYGNVYSDYCFENCEGVAIFQYYDKKEDVAHMSDSGIFEASDVFVEYKTTDIGTENKITATVKINKEYVDKYAQSGEDFVIRANCVFQTSDGKVYMTPSNNNLALSTAIQSISVSDSINVNEDGEEKEQSTSIDVSLEVIKPVDKTVICQMNSENELIESLEIDNSDIPKRVKINKKAEYIIVEKYTNNKISSREMIETTVEEDDDLSIELPVKDMDKKYINMTTVELKKKKD